MNSCAVILASGSGSRSGLDIPKQFYKIKEKTVLEYSIEAFERHSGINSILIVSNPDFIDLTEKLSFKYSKTAAVIEGGSYRQNSSYNGIKALENKNIDNVLIHDAARPFVSNDIISRCLSALETCSAVNTAVPSADTIIQIDENNIITNVPDRKMLRRCQTPQCFRYSLIKKAHELAFKEGYNAASDDCSLILKYNLAPVYVIEGAEENIKITYPMDIKRAEEMLKGR